MLKKNAARAVDRARSIYMRACQLCCPVKNKAVFASFGGKAYSDNPRAISEALHELSPETDIVWLFQQPNSKAELIPPYVRTVKIHSARAIFELATARIWVDNMPKPLYTTKHRGRTYYIQTWHGDRGFKKMLYDAPDHPAGKEILEKDICDLMLSGSTFCEATYRTGFRYFGEIMRAGCPRNDKLLRPDGSGLSEIRSRLGIAPGQKVLLYAPTMRNESRRNNVLQPIQQIDLIRALDVLGGEYVCVVRAHSTQLGLGNLPDSNRIIDASKYEDMADILSVTDLLITDYSSCASDFALTGKPIVLFQNDRDQFMKSERTFYFDMDASPYRVAFDQAELELMLALMTPDQALENDQQILRFYGAYETGEAAKKCAKWIVEHMC